MSFPVVRLLGGGQPIGHIDAPTFLLHFVPYYAVALTMAAVAGAGSYTFAAFALSAANFWIHILSTIYTVLRKSGSFVVTPKKGAEARQPGAVMPALVAVGVLVAVSIYGLVAQPRRRHDQQRVVRRGPRLDPDDRMLGGAPETARPGLRGAWSRSRPSREAARARRGGHRRGGCADRGRRVVARGLRLVEFEQQRVHARARAPRPEQQAEAAARALPDRYVDGRRARRAARSGRRHRRRGPGVRDADGGGDRRPAALRQDLELDAGRTSGVRRADLVPVARWPRRRSPGGVRRRPGCDPRPAGRRPAASTTRVPARGARTRRRDHARSRSVPPRSRATRC